MIFLPSDGETRFEMFFADGLLSLDIFYELDDSGSCAARRRIRFPHAKYFFKTPFPGYSFFSCPDVRDLLLLNSLVEYGHSDMLDMEHKTSGATGYRHYRLFLHSTGVAIHVITQSCEISSQELID
jgi:hypothetical protein